MYKNIWAAASAQGKIVFQQTKIGAHFRANEEDMGEQQRLFIEARLMRLVAAIEEVRR